MQTSDVWNSRLGTFCICKTFTNRIRSKNSSTVRICNIFSHSIAIPSKKYIFPVRKILSSYLLFRHAREETNLWFVARRKMLHRQKKVPRFRLLSFSMPIIRIMNMYVPYFCNIIIIIHIFVIIFIHWSHFCCDGI